MREILFRAKSADNYPYPSRWEYGVPFEDLFGDYMMRTSGRLVEVKKETVGEYTGLTDKNGVKIFEGDIVTYPVGIRRYKGKIIFWCATFCIEHFYPKDLITTLDDCATDCKIVGNIYNNPELLGGDDNAE